MRRREFLKLMAAGAGSTVLCSCSALSSRAPVGKRGRVIVLAFDGLDPRVVRSLMARGRLPSFQRVADMGSFRTIRTTSPAQTPVAFSSIISGCDPGTHAIYDFIHRDPNPKDGTAIKPYMSMSAASDPASMKFITLGDWQLPRSGGEIEQLRRGPEFWDYLVKDGTDVSVHDVPVTYPPPKAKGPGRFHCLSGMGTPDILGTLSTFTVFGTDEPLMGRTVGGGRFVHLIFFDHHGTAKLEGPPNFLLKPEKKKDRFGKSVFVSPPELTVDLNIVRDPEHKVARIEVDDQAVLLNEGEWSDWLRVEFKTGIPGSTALSAAGAPTSAFGVVRLYLKQVHPHLRLYVSPINIDPTSPVNPVSTPSSLAERTAAKLGPFYTVGIPEDHAALTSEALNEDEFRDQAYHVLNERVDLYHDALAHFDRGCMFSYFGTSDLIQHMFWRDRDPDHPGRLPEQGDRYAGVIDKLYEDLDGIVAGALDKLRDEDTLIVLSDHGFTTFRRGLNVNTWLVQQGFMELLDPTRKKHGLMFMNTDWSRTRAYATGINSLFVNLVGREKYGSVPQERKRQVIDEVAAKLLELTDEDGSRVVERVDIVESIYPQADPAMAPDMIIGYAENYRVSWGTALGEIPPQVIEDNMDRWSGTHCISPNVVPGIFITNRPTLRDDPALWDVAPTILAQFGIETPAEMRGRPLLTET